MIITERSTENSRLSWDFIEHIVERESLAQYYGSFRRISRVMGREPTSGEIAWEQTQLNPSRLVTTGDVRTWERDHENLCSAIFILLGKDVIAGYRGDLLGQVEQGITSVIDRNLKWNAILTNAEGLKRYMRVVLTKYLYGMSYKQKERSITDFISRGNSWKRDKSEQDRFLALSVPSVAHSGVELLERVEEAFGGNGGQSSLGDGEIRRIWESTGGGVGFLQHIAEAIGVEDLNESDDIEDGDTSPYSYKSARNVTITEKGENVASGWKIDQVFSAIHRLPYEMKFLCLSLCGYGAKWDRVEDLFHALGYKSDLYSRIKTLPYFIKRRLITNSSIPYSLIEMIDWVSDSQTIVNVRNRFGRIENHKNKNRTYSLALGLSYRLLNRFGISHDKLPSGKVGMLLQAIGEKPNITVQDLQKEFDYKSIEGSVLDAIYTLLRMQQYSFRAAYNNVALAVKERIADLTGREEIFLRLHYGVDSGRPMVLNQIAAKYKIRFSDVQRVVINACFKIMDRLYELNGGSVVLIRSLTKTEICDLEIGEIFETVQKSTLYLTIASNIRQVLDLYYGKRYRVAEIESELGINRKRVNALLHYGRGKVKELSGQFTQRHLLE